MESRAARLALIPVALLQALALYALGAAIDDGGWPPTAAAALLAAYLLAAGVPLFIYLAPLRAGELHYDAAATGLVGLLLAIMGWHTGRVLAPAPDPATGYIRGGDLGQMFAPDLLFAAGLIVFITALLFRAWRDSPGEGLPWRCQLEAAWANALTLALVLAFIALFWALLVTWSALFSLIGIDVFRELFFERPFIYAATGLAGGIGLVLVRTRIGLVTAVRSICESLARVLAPLAAVIVIGFALTLPFAGIELLWQSGRRPTALLWLAAFMLLLANAAMGETGFSGRMRRLQWLVGAGAMLLLPLLVVAMVGLLDRVAVFGWTVPRLWAALVIAALMAYALAMTWSLLRHRALGPETVGRWNTALALALVAVLFAVHSPVADLRRMAAADQLARVLDGRTPTERFSAHHLQRSLGRYGRDALAQLRASPLAEDPAFLARLDRAQPGLRPREPFDPVARVIPHLQPTDGEALPPEVLAALDRDRCVQGTCNGDFIGCLVAVVDYEDEDYWVVLGIRVHL
ncbi:MAG: DUF4153 domain-containing protein, partial [Gammaproteobacteria bacterium]|nr:DUF4153 domain-containing protein [Gammaproteobacteria bacterium]